MKSEKLSGLQSGGRKFSSRIFPLPAARRRRCADSYMLAVAVSLAAGMTGGCALVAVTDAAVSVAATTVKVGANVVGATVDVARAGIHAVTRNDDERK
jgi:hypothetical protein